MNSFSRKSDIWHLKCKKEFESVYYFCELNINFEFYYDYENKGINGLIGVEYFW